MTKENNDIYKDLVENYPPILADRMKELHEPSLFGVKLSTLTEEQALTLKKLMQFFEWQNTEKDAYKQMIKEAIKEVNEESEEN